MTRRNGPATLASSAPAESEQGPAADQAAPDVSESGVPAVEHVNKMKKDEAVQLQTALEQRLTSAEGPQTPEEVVDLTKVLKAVQRRIRQLNQVTAKGQRTKWKNAVDAKHAEIEGLQTRVNGLRQESFLLRDKTAQLTAEEEGLVAVLDQLTKDQHKLEGAGASLQAAEALLSDSQSAGLTEINDEEADKLGREETTYEALLAELERRHKEIVENIKAEAASARRALRLDVAREAQNVVERKGVHGKAEATHAKKVEQVTLRQTSLAQQREAIEAQQRANFDALGAAQAALEQAGNAMESLQGKRPPVPAPVREGIDPDATLAPEADGLEKDRRKDEMAERTLALDITLETMPRKLDQLAIGLNETQSAMDRDSHYEFGQDRPARVTPKEDFRVVLGEQGHTNTLKELSQEIQEAERKAGELDAQVLGKKEVERYQSAVEKLKKELEEEAVFLDALKIWLESKSGRVPQRKKAPKRRRVPTRPTDATPPQETPPPLHRQPQPPPAAADSHGLIGEGRTLLAVLGESDDDDDGTAVDASSIDLDDATGEDLLAADHGVLSPQELEALRCAVDEEAPTAPARLPILTPAQVQKIKDTLDGQISDRFETSALEDLLDKEPSPEWVEILELASRHRNPEIRRQVPRYAARLATFLSSDDLSHDRTLNAAGRNFFKTFPKDQDPRVANQATGYLNDLVRAKHFLPREVRKVAGIVTLYLKKHSDDQGIDDRGMERGNVLGLVRDLIEEIKDIHDAAHEAHQPPSLEDGQTIERIHEFLYHLFKAVLNSPDRENYPETVINDILDILENFPDCLEYKAVCDLPLSNKEKITIMTGRTNDIVNGVEERIEDGVGIAEIRDEFKGRGFALKSEAEFFMWEGITDAEVQTKNNLIRATDLLDERLWGTEPSIELGDIEVLLAETTAPNDSVLEQEISGGLDILLGGRGFPHVAEVFNAMIDVIANSTGDEVHIELSIKIAVEGEKKWLSETAFRIIKEADTKIRQLKTPSPKLNQKLDEADATYSALAAMYNNQLKSFL